jgi:single-strand DNA-binding protein
VDKLFVIGRLGRDPEMRFLPNGDAVTSFSVATDRRVKKDGNWEKSTVWYRVSVFGKQAEACNEFLAKGRQVCVEGSLNFDPATGGPRVYTKTNGSTGASFEIQADRVEFLGNKGENGNGNGESVDAADNGSTVESY